MVEIWSSHDAQDAVNVGLRSELDRFIHGEPRASLLNLCSWMGALRLLRCVERQTEASNSGCKLQVISLFGWFLD